MQRIANNYYAIAIDDIYFIQDILFQPRYNQAVTQIQQAAEKLLKSVAELVVVEQVEETLKTHNLSKIYRDINDSLPEELQLKLNNRDLNNLRNFYFDAKYPGENFITADIEDANEALDTMYDVLEEVNVFREKRDLPVSTFERRHFEPPLHRGRMQQ